MQYNTETGTNSYLGTVFVYTLIGTADTGYVSVLQMIHKPKSWVRRGNEPGNKVTYIGGTLNFLHMCSKLITL